MNEHEYESMRDLGKRYGVSSHEMGKWLAEQRLRTVGENPTPKAFDLGLVKNTPTNRGDGGGYFYVWHVAKTMKLLAAAGHTPLVGTTDHPKAATLTGPFAQRVSGTNGYEILNGDGEVALWIVGEKNAKTVVKLLNIAHRHGKLPKA